MSLIIINQSELGLKISFRRLISQLCILDTTCIIFSILMFSIPFHSEFYRLQVEDEKKIIVKPKSKVQKSKSQSRDLG